LITNKVAYMLSIGIRISNLGWPWVDFGWPLCALLHYTCLSETTT